MEQVIELMKDEAFMEELVKLEEEKDVIALFASRGVSVTMDDLRELFKEVPEDEEMSEEDLQKVSGGILYTIGPLTTVTPKYTVTVRTVTTILTPITRTFRR